MKEVTKRIMLSFLSHALVLQLNWTGQGGKVAFGKTKSADVIRSKYYAYVSLIHIIKEILVNIYSKFICLIQALLLPWFFI